MPSSVNIGTATYMAGPTYDAALVRYGDAAALAWNGDSYAGVYQSAKRLKVTATSGMNISVDRGSAVIPSAAGTTDGAYRAANNQARTLTAGTSDPTNPRIDLVVIGVTDNGDATSTTFVKIVAGVPAASPAVPATPGNAVALAQVRVNAGVTSIISGNITDVRAFTVCPGGIIPVASAGAAALLPGTDGQYVYDTQNDRLLHISSTGLRQARTLPFAPAVAARTVNQTASGGESTLCSVAVTTSGSTDLELIAKVNGHYNPAGGGYQVSFRLYIDGNQVFSAITDNRAGDGVTRGGCGFTHVTSSATGDTPSAGTHTVTLRWAPQNNGTDTIHVTCDPDWPATLYARAVPL